MGQLKAVLCALNSEPVLEWEMVNDMHYVTFPSSFLLVLRRGGTATGTQFDEFDL